MFNLDKELRVFEINHVKLSVDQRSQLAGFRDANLERLNSGLLALGKKKPGKSYDQGSYDTRTTVQQLDDDYDIDTALVFDKEDLPDNPEQARQLIKEALDKAGGNFKKAPTVRTNAVTVWYQDGHHVDMAVYRVDSATGLKEHASSEWRVQGVKDVSTWFESQVALLSPQKTDSMPAGQLRRVVRLLKMFGKTRTTWNMPGGLIFSTLAAENYVVDSVRDDVAFVKTARAIYSRLQMDLDVSHPTQPWRLLTEKEKYRDRVVEFRDKLGNYLVYLERLEGTSCTKLDAIRAWKSFFSHHYWDGLEDSVNKAMLEGARINAARTAGSLGVSPSGGLTTDASGLVVPKHRFHGEEKKS